MEAMRDQYGLTALRIGHQLTADREPQLTFALDSPGRLTQAWEAPAAAALAAAERSGSEGFVAALGESRARLGSSETIHELQARHEPLWLAVTADHPLLPGMPWEDAFGDLDLPLLRMPVQISTLPTAMPPHAPRIAICLSMPVAHVGFDVTGMVEQVLGAVDGLGISPELHVFTDAETAALLRSHLSYGLRQRVRDRVSVVHDPAEAASASRAASASGVSAVTDDDRPWLGWIEQQMEGHFDVLHLIGHGQLTNGEGAFAVAESPTSNRDGSTARFLWPQQITTLMTSCGVWGLVVTAVPGNVSTTGLRLMATQVAALAACATIMHDPTEVAEHPESLAAAYRALLTYPATAPADTRGLLLSMHPMRFGMAPPPSVTGYHPADSRLAVEVEGGAIDDPAMVAAQNQVRQWETQLQFDSTDPQVAATRDALEVAKARLDAVMFGPEGSGAGEGGPA